MLACSQRGALEERRTKSTHEMFPAPHSQSSAWHANINFIFTDTFFNSREDFVKKQGLLVVYPNLGIWHNVLRYGKMLIKVSR